MAKIVNWEQKTYMNKPSGFKATLDTGTVGNVDEKASDTGLRVGGNVIVTLIPYTSKKGVQSNLLGLRLTQQPVISTQTTPIIKPPDPQPTPRPTINVGSGKSAQEMKADASTKILLKILDVFYGGKFESAKISVDLMEFSRLIWSEIDEIYSQK